MQYKNTHLGTFPSRLRYIAENYLKDVVTISAFSGLADIPYRTFQNYLRGERSPNFEALVKLASLGINIHWLLTGDGRPFVEDSLDPLLVEKIILVTFDELLKKCVISEASLLTDAEKINLVGYLKSNNHLGLGEYLDTLREYGHLENPTDMINVLREFNVSELIGQGITSRKGLIEAIKNSEKYRERSKTGSGIED